MHYVLVHGGGLDARCWSRMLAYLSAPALAVDLPGRGARPADLATVTIAGWVDSVVADIEAAGLADVVLVGHSLAGVTLPGVAHRVPERIRRVAFLSCSVPPPGGTILDTLEDELRDAAVANATRQGSAPGALDPEMARLAFCNDMDDEQTRFMLGCLVPESMGPVVERVPVTVLPEGLPRTWVVFTEDRAVPPERQYRMIANVGGAEVRALVAGHCAMVSRPRELAALLDQLAGARR